jgi:hypothetical protein
MIKIRFGVWRPDLPAFQHWFGRWENSGWYELRDPSGSGDAFEDFTITASLTRLLMFATEAATKKILICWYGYNPVTE